MKLEASSWHNHNLPLTFLHIATTVNKVKTYIVNRKNLCNINGKQRMIVMYKELLQVFKEKTDLSTITKNG